MFRMRRTGATVLLIVLAISLAGVAPGVTQEECAHRIGLVTDVGRLRDQSFNEASWNAIEQAADELGLGEECYDYIETQDSADYIPNIELFISEGYDIIVTSGEAMTTAMREAGRMYPDVLFIGTDQPQLDEDRNYDPIPNVAGIVFDESVSGFLAGALAASMSESGVIGGVYGTDIITPVVRFRLGYEEGARYINPDIQVLGAYHPGTLDQAFVDPQWGAETAKLMIDQGADVIFGAGGQTGNGALIAACEAGLPVIGVDQDQYLTLPEVQACIMSSATKDLVNAVYGQIIMAAEGTFEGGEVVGPATLAPFHEWEDKIPDEVKATIEEIKGLIDAGEIEVCPADDPEWGVACFKPSAEAAEEMDGEALVNERCTVCHGLDEITANFGQDATFWAETVDEMIATGAQLNEEEREVVIDWLASQE
ncbi:MAG: hypothetical protein Kow00120_18240 [Anaerolineae bacterium]